MAHFEMHPIGKIHVRESGAFVELEPRYREGLEGLEDFSHVQLLWVFDGCDNAIARASLREESPYRGGPKMLGVFATRSPMRPNPIALSCAQITYVDRDAGAVGLAYIDAEDGSPVLDLKPYTPSLDRVERPEVPAWCAHWPKSVESSGEFDWASVFDF